MHEDNYTNTTRMTTWGAINNDHPMANTYIKMHTSLFVYNTTDDIFQEIIGIHKVPELLNFKRIEAQSPSSIALFRLIRRSLSPYNRNCTRASLENRCNLQLDVVNQ